MKNIAADHQAIVEKLVQQELLPWLEHTGDPWRPTEVPANSAKAYT
ncbi:hypothetical protein Q8W13_09860 [Photobacterium damselae subsp. piscicida]|nr:hypothetical protein [Photobacterium damselae subsp. piscicida]MDP2544310.1 hypothetical protein [Photobacterium damselae subsp. piscicida]MDP2568098.1 hypothetical protein [Photobacterium damselae subsp. piscicida]